MALPRVFGGRCPSLVFLLASVCNFVPVTSAARSPSSCGHPAPPIQTLMNNTRLDYPEPPGGPLTPFICGSPAACLSFCLSDAGCGAMVYREPYEPLPIGFGCEGAKPTDGCCYPAPVLDTYQVFSPGEPATFGFVSAIVRYGPPTPPAGVPASWEPTYEMNRSISLYWRNGTGLEPAEFYDGYGLVMFDWAHAARSWINDYSPMDNAAGLAQQCEIVKSRNPSTRCIVYRNSVIALNQHRHISSVLDDPAFADFFLRFKRDATQTGPCWGEEDPRQKGSPWDPIWPTPAVCEPLIPSDVHVPMCDKAEPSKCQSVHYFDQNQCPQVPGDNWANDTQSIYQGLVCYGGTCNCGDSPCGEFLFNFLNKSMVDWWLLEHMGGGLALDSPFVDGLITDDFWSSAGPSEIDSNSLLDMGLSPQNTSDMVTAWQGAMVQLHALVDTREKFICDMCYSGDSMSTASSSQCTARLTSMCSPDTASFGSWYVVNYDYIQPPAYGIASVNEVLDVAYFLLTRGPWAWIAGGPMLGWHMSHWWTANQTRPIQFQTDLRPAAFNLDYGVPSCSCSQTAPGVFVRYWSHANVTIDCNSMQGQIDSF